METKFTSGPWVITGSGLNRYVEGNVRPGVLQEVAWCGVTEVAGQMEANARLIASAPDLLAALRDLMGDHGGSIGVSRTDDRALAALDAISKATVG